MASYTLFVDESGDFADGQTGQDSAPRSEQSQIVGVVAPEGQLTHQSAQVVLRECYGELHWALPECVHANELKSGPHYEKFLVGLTRRLVAHRWQPVRLLNNEGLGYGKGPIPTYTNMLAELAIRVLMKLQRSGDDDVTLHLFCAHFAPGGGAPVSSEPYQARLREYTARLAARHGLSGDQGLRRGRIEFGSARKRRELQLCDVLSNASYRDFQKCGDAAVVVRAAFGEYDFSLSELELLERTGTLRREGSLGLVARLLAAWMIGERAGKSVRRRVAEEWTRTVDELARLPPALRDAQLAVLSSWLEQLVEQVRDPAYGLRVADWLLQELALPLRVRLEPEEPQSLHWWSFLLHRWALTCANHAGLLRRARREKDALEQAMPTLASRWEYAPLLADALIAQAVHLTDALEFEQASRMSGAVAHYYEGLSALVGQTSPALSTQVVRSRQRGQALGTQLQAEMFAGLSNASRLDAARALHDAALAEFTSAHDRRRQLQYRAQIETYAGELATARSFLARSLGLSDQADHDAVAHHLLRPDPSLARGTARFDGLAQGFGLLHWLRLGARITETPDSEDWGPFVRAFGNIAWDSLRWAAGSGAPYPAQGVRRQLARIHVQLGDSTSALETLAQLRALGSSDVFGLIEVAAQIEVAALLWPNSEPVARRLLQGTDEEAGALSLLRSAHAWCAPFPAVAALVEHWRVVVDAALRGTSEAPCPRDSLLAATRRFGL